ncbi:MAG TPA: transglycosylase SLT domain-containing protein [Steroidobacteraceae bacterium]|nr:transglycosylase SLT domain-containing protein [Steroidobacteraceae bacterium]
MSPRPSPLLRPRAPRRSAWALRAACGLLAVPLGVLVPCAPAQADQQLDPALRNVVAHAIAQAQCFADRFDSAVWYKLMEPRLRARVADATERLEILKNVYCETHRAGEARLPPGLVMALIEVESRFDRWAVSSAGAVGLMQVMPFWPEQLGMRRYQLTHIGPNVQMGCAILRFYLQQEHHNFARALARYNGSVGRRGYSDLVLGRWARWTGADDMPGTLGATQRTRNSTGG